MPVVLLLPGIATLAVFGWLAVAVWTDNRRREREVYYKSDALKKIAEMEGGSAAAVLDYLREQDRNAVQRVLEGLKLGGLAAVAAGAGLSVFLMAIRPDSALYYVGAIPILIGAALLAYVYVLAPNK